MKKLTISDLATILQLDQSTKDDLIKNFDSHDDNLKDEILKILWNGIHELEDKLAQLKYQEYLNSDSEQQLTTNLYNEALKEVWNDFDKILKGETPEAKDIESIRQELKQNTDKELNTIGVQDSPSSQSQESLNNPQDLMKKVD